MRLLTLALLLVAGSVRGGEFEVDLMPHLEKLSNQRYPMETNTINRNAVKDYIIERMKNYGLDVKQQKFNVTIGNDPTGIGSELIVAHGTNVIGIQKAETNHPGAVVVVGADYDSNGIDDPLFQNGAGVAALLEVARTYSVNERWSGLYVANYTTIFVALDINSKLYKTSAGYPGGYHFVQNWLMPFLNKNTDHFGGAIILDSIMNVNYEPNSQTLSNNFQKIFPDTYDRLQAESNKGSFLAMVSMGNEKSATLRDQFSGSYRKNRKGERFWLEDMRINTGVQFDTLVQEFAKSSNINFWTAKDVNDDPVHLPALLLTDTKTFRALDTTACVTEPCRNIDLVTEERLHFVKTTVKSVTTFLVNRQATRLPEQPSSGMASLPSAIMTVLMLALVRLYM